MISNFPSAYLIKNCDTICLHSSCGDSMRLIPTSSHHFKLSQQHSFMNPICKIDHKHQMKNEKSDQISKVVKIQDIINRNYSQIECFQSCLRKLQDFAQILTIIQNSVDKNACFEFQHQRFTDFFISQAQKISNYYNLTSEYYFLDQLRDTIIQYRDDQISYKQFSQCVHGIIEDFNFIENQIYKPIVEKLNKGFIWRRTPQSNMYDCIENFADSIISMKLELLSKIIIGHSNQLENLTYFSYMTFSYLKIITRIFKRFHYSLGFDNNRFFDKEQKVMKRLNDNLISQLLKYGQYFENFHDIQNQLVTYSDCIELNPQSFEVYLILIKMFKNLKDRKQMKSLYKLSLLQFPNKNIFLAGVLESLNIQQSQITNILKSYQNDLKTLELQGQINHQQNEYTLLMQIFKEKVNDKNTYYLLKQYHLQNDRISFFNSLLNQILRKNSNSQNLNPLKKFEIVQKNKEQIIKNQQSHLKKVEIQKPEEAKKEQNTQQPLIQNDVKQSQFQNKKLSKRTIINPKKQINSNIQQNTQFEQEDNNNIQDENENKYNEQNIVNKIKKQIKKDKKTISNNSIYKITNYSKIIEISQNNTSNQDSINDQSTNYSTNTYSNCSRSSSNSPEILSNSYIFQDSPINHNHQITCVSINI